MRTALTCAAVAASLALTGCTGIPKDPDGTLDRVEQSHILRVGASPSEGRVTLTTPDAPPTGPEPDLASEFATTLGATVQWRSGGEEELVTAMEAGELDLLIGGLTDATPWTKRVSVTRSYATTTRAGEPVKHVMAVPAGENEMLVRLETFLDEATP